MAAYDALAPCATSGVMRLGETVVLVEPFPEPHSSGAFPFSLSAATLAAAGAISTAHGRYSQKGLVGRPYGSSVPGAAAPPGGGAPAAAAGAPPLRAAALRLTPELWTLSLPHRTQILFFADISLIVTHLALRPGSVVVESGTGSGSLTHALARAVAPGGAVHTFEFNAARAEQARNEFLAHGLAAVVRVAHRDAVADGFCAAAPGGDGGGGGGARAPAPGGVPRGGADAVFLDLPNPWEAVINAATALRPGGALCSFSPCIEQVARTAGALRAAGFEDVRTFETLLRPWAVRAGAGAPLKRAMDLSRGGGGGGGKRARAEGGGGGAEEGGAAAAPTAEGSGARPPPPGGLQPPPFREWPELPQLHNVRLQPHVRARGHTGFLTFCRLRP